MTSRLSLYWHTLRYLRPAQLYGRIAFRLPRSRPDTRRAPPLRAYLGPWVAPARRNPSMVGPREFHFLSLDGSLDEIGWDGPDRETLWRYNQHYFDDLNAFGSHARSAWHEGVLEDWVSSNPPATGIGWEPYPTSLRIVNWIKWALAGNELPSSCVVSLAVQTRWLSRRLETHLLGNHLFANAKALIFAGSYFEGEEADRWLRRGLQILAREVPEQILSDGGHFERSTMYHAVVLEDMLDLCNVSATFVDALDDTGRRQVDDWRNRLPAMCAWLWGMSHPDGEISFFNDAAFGIAPTSTDLFAYAARIGVPERKPDRPIFNMEASGYIRVDLEDAVLLIDAAPVGPNYLPGHAHADTLSFEFSVAGKRLIVNGGTSRYGLGALREAERATAAHSTVEIDGENSSEVWAGFRVARRARPFDISIHHGSDSIVVEAAHDGYKRLSGSPIHRRRWVLRRGFLEVCDFIKGRCNSAVARFHLHPEVEVLAWEEGVGALRLGQNLISWASDSSSVSIKLGDWHPNFGVAEPNLCIEAPITRYGISSEHSFCLRWKAT